MQMTLGEDTTKYHGKKEKLAVVTIAGRRFALGLSDTHRAALSQEAAKRIVENLARAAGQQGRVSESEGAQLHGHCRKLTGRMKEDAA